ncbi:peptidoglycan recognition protein family protein [Pseudomonas sp. DWP3-1-2]|uniref:peptidoglycan recognition protein family protein n=1 Tax=Pseudomonas sp. DWP3-1-2 TaxID=2804645 RepID=UPI003CE75EE1
MPFIRYKGSHLAGFNTGVIGIVLLQNLTAIDEGDDIVADARVMANDRVGYDTTPEIPPRQIDALLGLIKVLKSVFNIFVLGGHREFPFQEGKICPGYLALEFVRILRSQSGLLAPSKS